VPTELIGRLQNAPVIVVPPHRLDSLKRERSRAGLDERAAPERIPLKVARGRWCPIVEMLPAVSVAFTLSEGGSMTGSSAPRLRLIGTGARRDRIYAAGLQRAPVEL